MPNEQKHADMQLAFRTEGQSINAYIERTGGEAPFLHLAGSINQGLCDADPVIQETWKRLMALAVCRLGERLSGEPTQILGIRNVPAGGRA
jgi:hypothetical protein